MLNLLIATVPIAIILVVSEYLWRKKGVRGERIRKAVHVPVGIYVAFWPWMISWQAIQLLSIVLLVLVFVSKSFNLFHALSAVGRRTYGEIFFSASIGLCALLTTNKVFFMVAMLHLALADGLAAIIGRLYGRKWKYTVFGQEKTIIGSMVFWLLSMAILGLGLLPAADVISFQDYILIIALLPPVLTLIENVTPLGFDNVTVPATVIIVLNVLAK